MLHHSGQNETSRVQIHKDSELHLCVLASFSQQWGLCDASPFSETTDRGVAAQPTPFSREHIHLRNRNVRPDAVSILGQASNTFSVLLFEYYFMLTLVRMLSEKDAKLHKDKVCAFHIYLLMGILMGVRNCRIDFYLIIIYLLRCYVLDITTSSEI